MKTVVFGFQARFVPLVESGAKRQTIRALRKDGRYPQPGDFVHCYAGLRTRYSRRICRGQVTQISTINFDFKTGDIRIDAVYLSASEAKTLAVRDGFESAAQMLAWFKSHSGANGDGFAGYLTRWEPLP